MQNGSVNRVCICGLAIVLLVGAGCTGRAGPLGPSAIIVPDAITVRVGQQQTFRVQNADVARFTLTADAGRWQQFVAIVPDESANSITLVALQPPPSGAVYVSADLGSGRFPIVAVMAID
jgi:hypothetical protein